MTEKDPLALIQEKERRIKSLEGQLEEAKESYYQAIRELHISGKSLREIAGLVNLSHQRVHQIVEGQNKGWRPWLRPAKPELRCSFCGLLAEEVKKLVQGPNIFGCDACIHAYREALLAGSKDYRLLDRSSRLRCSFCGKLPNYKRRVVAGKEHQVCEKCIELSLKYMKEEAPATVPEQSKQKTTTVTLWLRVERNSKFVRGKAKAREEIERLVLSHHGMKKLDGWEYELTFFYDDDEHLDKQINDMLVECTHLADLRNCFIESDVRENGTDRSW